MIVTIVDKFSIRMQEPSIEGRKSRTVAIDKLVQFVDCAIHLFLRHFDLYPKDTFIEHKRFGKCVMLCDSLSVREYTKHFCDSLRTPILLDRVKAVIVSSGPHRLVVDLPSDFGRTLYYAIPPTESRSDLEIASLCSDMLADALSVVERKLDTVPLDQHDDPTTWSLAIETKATPNHAGYGLEVPFGFAADPAQSVVQWTRYPLKSGVVGDTVVVLVSVDTS